MQRQHDYDLTVYPVGMSFSGDCEAQGPKFNVIDVRNMEVLYQANTLAHALMLPLASINAKFHAGNADVKALVAQAFGLAQDPVAEPVKPVEPVLATLPAINSGEQA